MKEPRFGYNKETAENMTPPIQVDLNVDFDIINEMPQNITYDKTKGYEADGMRCVRGELTDVNQCLSEIERAVYFNDEKMYYTTPKVKIHKNKVYALSLPLERRV